ncbi:MAG: non-canonical purine NTP pyrophosphatase [Phycisphaerales bacterium]
MAEPDQHTSTRLPAGAARIVIATANPHKVQELRALLRVPGVEFLGLDEAARLAGVSLTEPAETGTTFEANATIKAESYAGQLGMPCLADDSGLEIDALGGRPGIISSHYCTDGREAGMSRAERDAANNQRVLRELAGVPPEERTARFVCVMCLAACPGRALRGRLGGALGGADVPSASTPILVRGTFEGRIGLPPRVPSGTDGFGYDPLFLVAPDFTRTGAELPSDEKNRISHRAAAARLILARLREMMSTSHPSP